ncbi:hypothetical protein [Rhizobium oryzicola]|uniref:Uncharacterized protein n=1 Tax=Rhizobium oryzicola TaxID=1232668 RepID=A0ABT8SS96_9HYPH|nr:hypothetical protein [Rhizobium oryzicola]MDO1580597.1 hypothetical protein [Rhizobium oryzicola]
MADAYRSDGHAADVLSELEARMVALEIISMTALAMALDTSENGDPRQARGIAQLISETVGQRCQELGLAEDARLSALRYTEQLLGTALASLYPGQH